MHVLLMDAIITLSSLFILGLPREYLSPDVKSPCKDNPVWHLNQQPDWLDGTYLAQDPAELGEPPGMSAVLSGLQILLRAGRVPALVV